ncbi:PiggyBac transposable element-derived protein 3 [Plakobranchus ocellatus]|uniref:PiggyBac transposable element-derived protein 3 n=1 Tax=Plakobranchus ocellatus TaxID=259542 RepID=A0AAV4AAR7_9GAST|nr:PiggyBac transposable element-derived protein 3 [Plakobranchus ocellatus]
MQRLLRCHDVYIDGTFRTCPSPYTQFFTIHGKYRQRVLPFATALLTGKTIGHYRQVLQVLKREIRRSSGHRWRPNTVICDFEQSLISAVETELPTAQVTCFYFHFCQSMWRRLNELGLSVAYRTHARFKKCIRRFLSMGYLPVAVVRQNVQQFCASRETQRLIRRYPSEGLASQTGTSSPCCRQMRSMPSPQAKVATTGITDSTPEKAV